MYLYDRIFRVYEDKCFNKQLLCPFCRVNNITSFIDKNVNKCKFNFHAGHIKSFYYGGLTDVDNLRPICGDCNRKMSKKNWIDYEMEIYPERFQQT